MKNYSIHRDSSFYTETGFLMHYDRVKSGYNVTGGVTDLRNDVSSCALFVFHA